MAPAISLQQFLLAFAYRLALEGEIAHPEIPDDVTSESERRQPFFFAAAGLPAFYVHRDSRNQLLREILTQCKKIRPSRRHAGYVRVPIQEYRRALLAYLQRTATDLIDAMNVQPVLDDLAARCDDEDLQASRRLLKGILAASGKDAMRVEAREFNRMAEEFYREPLRRQHLREALLHLREDAAELERSASSEVKAYLRHGVRLQDLGRFLTGVEERALSEELSLHEISALLNLLVLLVWRERRSASRPS